MLARGKYGVEYNPKPLDDDSSGLGWVVVAVIAVALVSLSWTLVSRLRSRDPAPPEQEAAAEAAPTAAESASGIGGDSGGAAAVAVPPAPPIQWASQNDIVSRPPKLRNLLMKLEVAQKSRDIAMEVATIEEIRALPGSPAADKDDELARRLGELNVIRLFVQKNKQWVSEVVVKRGDSASRIASEHGSTLASMRKLNEKADLNRVKIGQKLHVMNHPRFNLVVHRRSRTADLQLNGKFFKRYDLATEPKAPIGARTWRESANLELKPEDRAELDVLLPKTASVTVSEM